ncbi:MAG: phosphoenolpyruvate synthase, partial [Proteobacteria bacterium]|nr:phosphoenolpyruvate synthase [Pseudomonadota bacterium]
MATQESMMTIRSADAAFSCTQCDVPAVAVPALATGLHAFAERYDLFLVDQWGVLHDGQAAFPGAIDCLRRLTAAGKRVVILSNSGKRAETNAARLAAMGIDASCYSALVTSGEVTRQLLADKRQPLLPPSAKRCLLWSTDDDVSLVEGLDIQSVQTVREADFILLAGVSDAKPMAYYETLLYQAKLAQLPLICANPDTVRFTSSGLRFSAGAVARRYEEMGGEVHYVGKPHGSIYEYCRGLFPGMSADRAIAIGDSFFHDVVGGLKAGLHTAFVTGGIHRDDFAGLSEDAERLAAVETISKDYGVMPDWIVPRLQWGEAANAYVIRLEKLRNSDVGSVGGKNASLGEMLSQLAAKGVRVPGGFATTAQAYRDFLAHEGLAGRIAAELENLDVNDVAALAACGAKIRQWIMDAPLPEALEQSIAEHYQSLAVESGEEASFAVRSSATAEDLPDASFAGQQETFLNIVGLDNILQAIKEVFASLYNDRAIAYRVHKGFIDSEVALSAGVQRMVRSDLGSAGVMFSLDTESGFQDVVFITSSYGLGESVVQGAVNPDEFYVHKPLLADERPAVVRRTLGSKRTQMLFSDSRQAGK